MDVDAWREAGLLDSDTQDRRQLLAYLAEQGCTLEEMVAAHARGRLYALAGDRVLLPGGTPLTLADVAERLDADVQDVTRVWRALGLPDRGADVPVAGPRDLEAVSAYVLLKELVGPEEALAFMRVVGSAAARVADAGEAALRRLAALDLDRSPGEAVTARAWADAAALVPAVSSFLDVVLRHHVEAVRVLVERTRSSDVAEHGLVRLGVGFADLSGWTALSARLSPAALSGLVTRFEEVSQDVVSRHGGRVVKLIGDAVMWVAGDPVELARGALGLVEAAAAEGLQARAGVTHDLVLARDGDYFGAAVNLAARLVGLAEPGEVLLPAALGAVLAAAGFAVDASGPPLEVRGVTGPVAVGRLAIGSAPA